jgi:hypothetical protein
MFRSSSKAFCTDVEPDKFADAWIDTPLSARWQQAVIRHAASIAQSWRTNHTRAYQEHLEDCAWYAQQTTSCQRPRVWKGWNTPVLKQIVLQTTANVAALESSEDSTFDYWLRISTLEKRQPIRLPVKLADYHRRALDGQRINTSMTLTRKPSGWWLTLTVDEIISPTTDETSPVVGVDVGVATFITTSTGKRYGTFHGKLAKRHQYDREKRQRKVKLRTCLEKKGVERLPSLTNQRLARHVRQEINRAVKEFYADHAGYQIAYEALDVRGMRFLTRRMNAYLRASNLAHLPKQLVWVARNRGQTIRAVWAAYSSQACSRCSFADRANRPTQQTFCCQACGFRCHADENAAVNLQARFQDEEIQQCRSKDQLKALLHTRHMAYNQTGSRSAFTRREPTFGCESVSGQSGVGEDQRLESWAPDH